LLRSRLAGAKPRSRRRLLHLALFGLVVVIGLASPGASQEADTEPERVRWPVSRAPLGPDQVAPAGEPGPVAAQAAAVQAEAAQELDAQALPGATRADGPRYPVSELVITYIDPNPQFPSPEEMAQIEVEMSRSADGLVGPRAELPTVRFVLAEFGALGVQNVYGSALRALNQQLVFDFNRRDFHAIVVAPLEDDIERRTGRDLRTDGNTRLRLGIYAGRVKDLRSFASGEGYESQEDKLDLPQHTWIREASPIQPGTDRDLVRKDQLDEYLARLNRHPARRVDAEISPARDVGGVNLDYMVAENKPWWVYFQIENTGTEETTDLRERFGLAHSNLTGRDDLAMLDYITGDFDEVQAVLGSYEIPFTREGRFKARVFGDWSEYDASVLGFNNSFTGEQIDAGAQLIFTAFQYQELFADLILGGQYQHVEVENELAGTDQVEDFAIGMLGLRTDRQGVSSSLNGELFVLHNFGDLASTHGDQLNELGRLGVDEEDYTLIRWNLDLSFFVEPLLSPRTWRDPSLIDTASLAHEIALSFNGQNALDDRLIPQQQQVAGGLYSVRGYEESAAVGDDVEIGSLEYRLHLPRLLAPSVEATRVPVIGEFHTRPKYQYTFPDWDLILRGFVDFGHVSQVDANSFEDDQTLWGAGFGAELRLLRYFTGRVDVAWALRDVEITTTDEVESGDSEIHFSVTLLY
jgi:hemolysin activation/secretion protein